MIKTFYWRGKPNFGDRLGPLLLEHFGYLETEWAPPGKADVVTVGSVLHLLPPAYAGVVAGAGKLRESERVILPRAQIFGLRGPLSAKGVKGDYVLGDPGLLADELVAPMKEHKLGLVPHWSDTELEHRPEFKNFDPLIIRPDGNPIDVLHDIGSCLKIVSSSLHGIITADAFGIPRRIEMAARFDREGKDYKFRDHNAAVGVRHEIGLTQEAPRYKVQDRQHELFDMLEAVAAYLRRTVIS